jgi:hypothetical protein
MNTIEGSLDILWENNAQPMATPRYMLIFARYQNFKNGGQPSRRLVGDDALENYLVNIGFQKQNVMERIQQVHEKQSVSIPNVMMPEVEMAVYEAA